MLRFALCESARKFILCFREVKFGFFLKVWKCGGRSSLSLLFSENSKAKKLILLFSFHYLVLSLSLSLVFVRRTFIVLIHILFALALIRAHAHTHTHTFTRAERKFELNNVFFFHSDARIFVNLSRLGSRNERKSSRKHKQSL